MLISSHQFALGDTDVLSVRKPSLGNRVALQARSDNYSGDIYLSMSWEQAKAVVGQLQALIDAEFGPEPADNVVAIKSGDAA